MRFDANIAASGTISAPFGSFDSLTVSGQPVSTGTGGGASLDPAQDQTITGNWDFQAGLTKNNVDVATVDDLFVPVGTTSVVSGTIIRPLGTAHSPIVLFNFDGDLTDSSGNGHDLTVEAGTQNIVRLGPFLSGHAFDGGTVLVAADTADTELTGDMTLQCLISYSVDAIVADTKSFVGQTGAAGDGDDTNNFLYRMALNSTDTLTYFGESAGGANESFSTTEHFTGRSRQLTHVALVRENNDVTYYLDGNVVGASSGLSAPLDGSATRFRIGGEVGTNRFTGVIASVKLIGSALSAYQVRKEYESTLSSVSLAPELLQDDSFKNLLHVQDRKAVNTPGGTFTQTAFQTRDLNTITSSGIAGATLVSNQIILQPGTYYAEFVAPAFAVGRHKAYFFDVDGGASVLLQGSSEIADTTGNVGNSSVGAGKFTITTEANIEIRHRCQVTKTTSGFGLESNHNSFDELYTDVRIWPIDETGTSLNNLTAVSGTFTDSLTVSGVPVNIGASGGGSSIDESQVALISQVFGS